MPVLILGMPDSLAITSHLFGLGHKANNNQLWAVVTFVFGPATTTQNARPVQQNWWSLDMLPPRMQGQFNRTGPRLQVVVAGPLGMVTHVYTLCVQFGTRNLLGQPHRSPPKKRR
jgi:hypothetical protein